MPKRRGIWDDRLDMNTLKADRNLCTQLGIPVEFDRLSALEYMSRILVQISITSNIPLYHGDKTREDL